MKTILSIADMRLFPQRREALRLKEQIPFWFAVSSPLIGVLVGLLGAWFVAWLNM